MDDCIFCKLANGIFPTNTLYEDEDFRVILDIEPATKGHALILPKKHFANIIEADAQTVQMLFDAAKKVAKELGVDKDGFRLVINTGKFGGQTVDHLHIHLLGGRELGWPPG